MSLFPSHSKMDYSVYRMFGQMQNTEESMMQKPRKHPYHCQRTWTCKDNPKCPKWHQTALRLTSVAMVTLVATVIGLTVWVSHLRIYSCSDNPSERFSSDNGTKDYSCMNLSPRKQQNSTNFIRNPSQNLCPNDWVQKKGKCYNFFKTYQSWIDSQKFCSTMKSHLLVIQDKAELDFLQSNIQDGIYFWIGLNISNPQKTWTWLDGTPLNLQLFQVLGEVEDDACALITKKGVFSEKCLIQNYWICQGVVPSSTDNNL
ncbi:killer cell lectin-like receptor subfamily F member 1 isoform X1 [Odocoileus virginianus]|uniref:Killer cell lectin-like receptor subfamily F member 1 isoform X1 n=3 Tax=Odocoileus virginianus TaxID=9874 RepID=A0ABM4HWZ4_ODOVR